MGWRPDWAGAAKGGLEALEDIILGIEKEKKRRRTVDDEFNKQMELLDYQQQLGIDRGRVETYWEMAQDENFNLETRQYFAEKGGLIPSTTMGTLEPGGVVGMEGLPPTTVGEMGPGGVAGMVEGLYSGGYTPPPTGEMPGILQPSAVAEEEGELFGRVEEEKTYKEKVRNWIEKNPNKPYPGLSMQQTHKVVGAYIAPTRPTGAMPETGLENLEQKYRKAAADIRRGKTLRTGWGGMKREVMFTTPEIAVNEIQSEYGIGPGGKWGLWDKYIVPEISTKFPGYLESPERYEIGQLKKDVLVRKKVRTHLRKDLKIRGVTEEMIDMYIEKNSSIARQLK